MDYFFFPDNPDSPLVQKGTVILAADTVVHEGKVDKIRAEFTLMTPKHLLKKSTTRTSDGRTYILAAPNKEERSLWINAIKDLQNEMANDPEVHSKVTNIKRQSHHTGKTLAGRRVAMVLAGNTDTSVPPKDATTDAPRPSSAPPKADASDAPKPVSEAEPTERSAPPPPEDVPAKDHPAPSADALTGTKDPVGAADDAEAPPDSSKAAASRPPAQPPLKAPKMPPPFLPLQKEPDRLMPGDKGSPTEKPPLGDILSFLDACHLCTVEREHETGQT